MQVLGFILVLIGIVVIVGGLSNGVFIGVGLLVIIGGIRLIKENF